jgi:hypothetical protein
MKKLEAINLAKCDELSHIQMDSVMGGLDTSTHKSNENEVTGLCGGDIAYLITWDCGGTSSGMWCIDEVDE